MAAYKIPITTNQTAYPDQPEMWEHLYTAQDYWLAEELGVDSNYEVDQIAKTELELTASTGTITFASEYNCFFAHMETPRDRDALRSAVRRLVTAARADARPRHLTVVATSPLD